MTSLTLDLKKKTVDQDKAIAWHPKLSYYCGNFTLDFKPFGFSASPIFFQTLDFQLNHL